MPELRALINLLSNRYVPLVLIKKSWQQELHKFLRIYRCTPHSTTRFTPYRLMFGREPRTKLPEISSPITDPVDQMVRSRDERAKRIMKSAADTRNHATDRRISVGDAVFTKQRKNNKLTPVFNASTHCNQKKRFNDYS